MFYDSEIEKPEREPTKCPVCGSSVSFDREFYREYGSVNSFFLRYRMGIEPLVA
jgi:oligoribonuclease (3'-5' exoribonuclease)